MTDHIPTKTASLHQIPNFMADSNKTTEETGIRQKWTESSSANKKKCEMLYRHIQQNDIQVNQPDIEKAELNLVSGFLAKVIAYFKIFPSI